jgi:hypothetical protein
VGSINFLFDPSQEPHLRADELAELTGVAKRRTNFRSSWGWPRRAFL